MTYIYDIIYDFNMTSSMTPYLYTCGFSTCYHLNSPPHSSISHFEVLLRLRNPGAAWRERRPEVGAGHGQLLPGLRHGAAAGPADLCVPAQLRGPTAGASFRAEKRL